MKLGLLALGLATGGAVGAALADAHYPDKSYQLPSWVPGIGGQTLEPGTLLAGVGLGLGVITGFAPLLALGAGSAIYEGGKMAAAFALPGPGAAPQLPPTVSGMRGYENVTDREVLRSLGALEQGFGAGRF